MRLEADTFLDNEFLNMTNQFNSIKINADKKEGAEITEQYHVNGFPTVIFVDKEGLEIDRIIGYVPPENFISMVTDLLAGKNTIPALEKMLENNPNDFETIFKIAQKYMDRGEMEIAKPHFNNIINDAPKEMKYEIQSSHFSLAQLDLDNGDIAGLQKFIMQFPNSDQCFSAYQIIARFYTTENDTIAEVKILKEMTEAFPGNANAMNSYAWRMTELKQNLEDALIKAKMGVELANEDMKPMILDTQAEVEWLLGDKEAALHSIKEAIKLDADNEYYLSQLERFEE